MTTSSSSSDRNPVEALAEEFLGRKRARRAAHARGVLPTATPSWPTRSATSSPS